LERSVNPALQDSCGFFCDALVEGNYWTEKASAFPNADASRKITKICEENDIVFMALFGSFVRGDQKKRSDIDILIRFDETKEKSLLDLIHAENELKKLFKRKVDFLTIGSISPYMREEVLNSMKVIYEKWGNRDSKPEV